MRLIFSLIITLVGFASLLQAQVTVDIKSVIADPNTQMFNDGKHNVHGYVYAMIETHTPCCGSDKIYLRVDYDKSGAVSHVESLTGKNDCFKKAVSDIIKTITWDGKGVKGTRTIYFEVAPIIGCNGGANENVYSGIPGISGTVVANNDGGNDDPSEESEVSVESKASEASEVSEASEKSEDAVVVNDTGDDDNMDEGNEDDDVVMNDDGDGDTSHDGDDNMDDSNDDNVSDMIGDGNNWDNMYDNDSKDSGNDDNNNGDPVTVNSKGFPNQMSKDYDSAGDRDPDNSHEDSFWNGPGPTVQKAYYAENENQVAILIKRHLRSNGICGLAQALIELTVDPNGNVIHHNVLKTNSDAVSSNLPEILQNIRFTRQSGMRANYITYIQFKTDIICEGEGTRDPIDLEGVQDYISNPLAN